MPTNRSKTLFLGIFLAVSLFLVINYQQVQAGLISNPYFNQEVDQGQKATEKTTEKQVKDSQNSPKMASESPNAGLLNQAKARVAKMAKRGVEWLKNKVWSAIVREVNKQKEKMMEKIKATILGSIEAKFADLWQKIKDIF